MGRGDHWCQLSYFKHRAMSQSGHPTLSSTEVRAWLSSGAANSQGSVCLVPCGAGRHHVAGDPLRFSSGELSGSPTNAWSLRT